MITIHSRWVEERWDVVPDHSKELPKMYWAVMQRESLKNSLVGSIAREVGHFDSEQDASHEKSRLDRLIPVG